MVRDAFSRIKFYIDLTILLFVDSDRFLFDQKYDKWFKDEFYNITPRLGIAYKLRTAQRPYRSTNERKVLSFGPVYFLSGMSHKCVQFISTINTNRFLLAEWNEESHTARNDPQPIGAHGIENQTPGNGQTSGNSRIGNGQTESGGHFKFDIAIERSWWTLSHCQRHPIGHGWRHKFYWTSYGRFTAGY